MIRYSYIYSQILRIYRRMDTVVFPIEPCDIVASMPNCRMLTYQQFARQNYCSVERVRQLCQSDTGCTHLDPDTGRYLILWNDEESGYNVPGRQRWTKAHELGHVVLRHLPVPVETGEAGSGFCNSVAPEREAEADRFASALLCPMPLFEFFQIHTFNDIMAIFGLSARAAQYRWEEYQRWQTSHRKAAWEDEIRQLIHRRASAGKLLYPAIRPIHPAWIRSVVNIWNDEEVL